MTYMINDRIMKLSCICLTVVCKTSCLSYSTFITLVLGHQLPIVVMSNCKGEATYSCNRVTDGTVHRFTNDHAQEAHRTKNKWSRLTVASTKVSVEREKGN